MRHLRAPLVLGAFLAACSPVTHDLQRNANRSLHNRYVHDCEWGDARACFVVGENLSGHGADPRAKDWSEAVDPPRALAAYEMGCMGGGGESCQAILERNLVPDEKARGPWLSRALVLNAPPRAPEQIAAEETEIQERVAKKNETIDKLASDEQADLDRQWREGLQMSATGLGAIAQGQDPAAAIRGGGADGDGGMKLGGGQQGGCGPCAGYANTLRERCVQPHSAACYCEAANMHHCTELAPGCVKDKAAAHAEVTRMMNAARDAGGACMLRSM
jgi:hypothetical protein